MFDAGLCAGMYLGNPHVSLSALERVRDFLNSLGFGQSTPSNSSEKESSDEGTKLKLHTIESSNFTDGNLGKGRRSPRRDRQAVGRNVTACRRRNPKKGGRQ